jgi:hypothetical protein
MTTTNPWETAAKQHAAMEQELKAAQASLAEYRTLTAHLEGKVDALTRELDQVSKRRDHYLGLYYEVVKQLNTIGLVVDDAIHTARIEFPNRQNGNTTQVQQHVEAVERALTDMSKTSPPTEESLKAAEDVAKKYAPPKYRTDSTKHDNS